MYFSARSASWAPLLFQQITRCHSVFSCFSPPCPVHCRLVASDNVATREPLLVLRTSGSAPKFPISMPLLRLRLTKNLRTLGGSGPRATTVYDPQVILSIKDTPLGLKFCRHPSRGDGSAQDHRVLHGTAVVARPPGHLTEPEGFIQPAGTGVRLAHLEVHHAHAPRRQCGEHLLHQRPPHAAATMCQRHSEVEDLALSRGAKRDSVARDQPARLGDEERHLRRHTLGEVAARPGIGEHNTLDRGDVVDVSQRGRTNPGRDGRGAPPIEPALRQGVRKRARRRPARRADGPRRRAPASRAAWSRREGSLPAAPEDCPASLSSGPRSGRRRRRPPGGGAPARSARTPRASARSAAPASPHGPGGRYTSRRTPDRAARRNRPPPARCPGAPRRRRPPP